MSEKAKGGKKEKREGKDPLPSVENFSLAKSILEGNGEVLKEYELERRFLPNRLLTKQELAALETRLITQKYVTLKNADGTPVTFRLRITRNDIEGLLYRIARKSRVGDLFGKEERQIRFMPTLDDPRTKEHQHLWNLSTSRTIQRQRYYIPHTLPNGGACEIHYEVWLSGKEDGFVRIEVEFSNDEDEKYYEAHAQDKGILPDWIGDDVTFEPEFLAKNITKDGLPKQAVVHMKTLRKKEG
ncbi:MAG: hypothetical protein AAB440_03350 [Patescibacteria group bacterium]